MQGEWTGRVRANQQTYQEMAECTMLRKKNDKTVPPPFQVALHFSHRMNEVNMKFSNSNILLDALYSLII